jgi:hypothetical protein
MDLGLFREGVPSNAVPMLFVDTVLRIERSKSVLVVVVAVGLQFELFAAALGADSEGLLATGLWSLVGVD